MTDVLFSESSDSFHYQPQVTFRSGSRGNGSSWSQLWEVVSSAGYVRGVPTCCHPCPEALGHREKAADRALSSLFASWHLPRGTRAAPSSPSERPSHLEDVMGLKIAPGTSGTDPAASIPGVLSLLGTWVLGNGPPSAARPLWSKHKDQSSGNVCVFMKMRWPQPAADTAHLSVGVKSSLGLRATSGSPLGGQSAI